VVGSHPKAGGSVEEKAPESWEPRSVAVASPRERADVIEPRHVAGLGPADVYEAINSDPRGLSTDEALKRRARVGANSLPSPSTIRRSYVQGGQAASSAETVIRAGRHSCQRRQMARITNRRSAR